MPPTPSDHDQAHVDGPPAPPAGGTAAAVPEGAPQAPFTLRPPRREGPAAADLTGVDEGAARLAARLEVLTGDHQQLVLAVIDGLADGRLTEDQVRDALDDPAALQNLIDDAMHARRTPPEYTDTLVWQVRQALADARAAAEDSAEFALTTSEVGNVYAFTAALPPELALPPEAGSAASGRICDIVEEAAGRDVMLQVDALVGEIMNEVEAHAFLGGWRAATAVDPRLDPASQQRMAVVPTYDIVRWERMLGQVLHALFRAHRWPEEELTDEGVQAALDNAAALYEQIRAYR